MISPMEERTVFTLGHGDRTLEDLLECLRSFPIEAVADVRSFPASRRQPWFSREELEPRLVKEGFAYRWFGPELGGFRAEGYEPHMKSDAFADGLARLAALAEEKPTAILCAERDPAGCHRRFLARALADRGFTIRHVVDPGRTLLPGEGPEDQGTLFPL